MAGKLYNPPEATTVRSLAIRAAFVSGMIATTVAVLWLERAQLVDHNTGEPPNLTSVIYFAMVTVTTVGYGDIVPVTTFARMVDTFFLVPIRFIILFTFVGTTYQVVLRRFQEEYRMKRKTEQLTDHIVVCGYGATGRAVVKELLLQGVAQEQIVAVDMREESFALGRPEFIAVVGRCPGRGHSAKCGD